MSSTSEKKKIRPINHKVIISYFLDSEREVYKKIDRGSDVEWERIKPIVGGISVHEGEASPMVRPFRELSAEEYHDFLYKGVQPSTKELLWAIRDNTSHSVDVNGNCNKGCC